MSKFYNDNKPAHKDLTADIDAGLGLGWRILATVAPWALAAGIAFCGFQIARACGVFV